MEILVTNDILWTVYGACLLQHPSLSIQIASKILMFIVIFFGFNYIQMSIAYIMVHAEQVGMKLLFYALLQIVYMSTTLVPYLTVVVQTENVKKMIGAFRTVVKQRWRPETEVLYQRADRSAHLLAKWPSLLMQIFFRSTMILAAVASLLMDLRRGHIEIEQWYSLHFLETPYNRFSGGGFIVFLIHQSLNQYALFGTQNCCLSIFIGLCFFLDALCTDFRLHFEEMDRLSAKNDSQSKHKLKSMVLDAIKFQQRIIELFTALDAATSGVLSFEVVCGTVFLATIIYQLELALDTFNLHLVMVISGMMLAISSILPYCYYASRMSYTINMNADHAYQSNWYLFTIDQQRSLQMILAHSQIKRNFTGYDIIDCSLEVFLMIAKGAASYVIVMKKFSG